MKNAILGVALTVFACLSCALPLSQGAASLRISVAFPGARSLEPGASPRLLNPDTSYILVEVSGADMPTISARGYVDNLTRSASVAIRNIPVSRQERTITVSAYSAADLLLSSGSSTQTLKIGSNAVNVAMTPAAGTTTALSSATHAYPLSFSPDNDSGVYELSFDGSGDYCVSLGYSSAEFRAYDAEGRPLALVKGTPEKWYIVRAGPARKCFLMISTGNANETLIVERAVYVAPGLAEPGENGTRERPYHGFQQLVYDQGTAPCRFLLARGSYEGVHVLVAPGKSLYGGFDPSTWDRDLKPSIPMTELRGDAGFDGILYTSVTAPPPDGDTIVDGLWIRANPLSSVIQPTSYYTVCFPASPSVQNCRITGPAISVSTMPQANFPAFYAAQNGTAALRIICNQISAGSILECADNASGTALYGLYIGDGSPNVLIAENEIDGGYVASNVQATQIFGSAVFLGGEAWFVNNTVGSAKLSHSGNSEIHCVTSMTATSSLHILNNILFDTETATGTDITSSCLEASSNAANRPVHIMNNYTGQRRLDPENSMKSCSYHFTDGLGSYWQPSLTTALGTDPNYNSSNNLSSFSDSTIFINYGDPSQLPASILGHDWALSSTAPRELLYGAVGYSTLTGSQVNLPMGLLPYLLYDRLGQDRYTSRWSMGAYQYGY